MYNHRDEKNSEPKIVRIIEDANESDTHLPLEDNVHWNDLCSCGWHLYYALTISMMKKYSTSLPCNASSL